ncbi:efflux RND transporter periplasmic adaptor subunit [uncultured Marinobacter sp.]|uniref:efflux RND transporter periplasmic adaptor subunit n=1 Tax=uncultured Marinobacter sp. TaxID=187379 RepID=UPI0030DD18C8
MSRMKWGSTGLALLILLALVIWMATGDFRTARSDAPEATDQEAASLPTVEVESRRAGLYRPGLRIQGQVEPWRSLEVTARVAGTVESIAVRNGQTVSAGDNLLVISEDERPAALARSRARVSQLEADLKATQRLRSDNLASESDRLRLESELASARAELRQASLAMDYLRPAATFDGVINHRHVEQGRFVQAGEPLFDLVQVDLLKVSGYVPQQAVSQVREGQAVEIELLDGQTLEGSVSFVASAADPETRSFRMEARLENPGLLRIAGGSATLRVMLPEQTAHFLSPALLSLGDDGRPGVLLVTAEDVVAFAPVTLLSVQTDGAWVAGLESPVRLISRGGGFVSRGQTVKAVSAGQGD